MYPGVILIGIPNKYLCILVPALFGTLIASIFCSGVDYALILCYFGQICIQFGANWETAPSTGDVWNEFSEQHKHRSYKKVSYSMPD